VSAERIPRGTPFNLARRGEIATKTQKATQTNFRPTADAQPSHVLPLACFGAPPSYVAAARQLEGGRDFVDEPAPIHPTLFVFNIHCTRVHAVGHRPRTAFTCLPGIFMHPHRVDDQGSVSVKHLWVTAGVSTRRQDHGTRQLPLWRVVVSSRCSRLASAPQWERLPEISKSRNLTTIVLAKERSGRSHSTMRSEGPSCICWWLL
jgi:hypothetical protein